MEQMRNVLIANLRETFNPEVRDEFVTYWADGADRSIRTYRVAEKTADSRDVSCVPLVEMLNACVDVVESSVSIPKEACVPAIGRALGYKRLGGNASAVVGRALEIAIEDGLVKESNGNLMAE